MQRSRPNLLVDCRDARRRALRSSTKRQRQDRRTIAKSLKRQVSGGRDKEFLHRVDLAQRTGQIPGIIQNREIMAVGHEPELYCDFQVVSKKKLLSNSWFLIHPSFYFSYDRKRDPGQHRTDQCKSPSS